MKYRWKLMFSVLLVILLIIVLFTGINLARASIRPDHFPLSKKWSTHLKDKVAALSIIDDKIVFARTKNALYALDVQSGKVVWHRDLSWLSTPYPALANAEMVYVVSGNVVEALSRTDGSIVWKQSVYSFDGLVLNVSDNILAVKDGRGIHIFDSSTGDLLQDNPGCRAIEQAYIDGDRVFVPCNGILRINVSTGVVSWWQENEGIIGNTGYADGITYFSQAAPSVVAFDLNNWTELWRTPINIDGFGRFYAQNDYVFLTDFSKICAFRRLDGSKWWCVDDVSYPQNLIVIRETVFVFNGNHKEITAFELISGKLIGKLEIKNLNYFSTDQQLMTSSENILFFSSGRDVFAFE